jgi:hypothetical protein
MMRILKTPGGRRAAVMSAVVALLLCGLVLMRPDWLYWLFPGLGRSFEERVALAGLLLSSVIALAAIPQLLSLADTSRSSHYSQLDSMYLSLLKIGVEKPYLRTPEGLVGKEAGEYQSYAYAVWNFVETLRDRCEDDQTLKDIWAPVIATEYELHGSWFYGETRPYWAKEAPKFRLQFADFIWTRFREDDPVCGNVLHEESSRWIRDTWKLRDVQTIRDDPDPYVKYCLGLPPEHPPLASATETAPAPAPQGNPAE